MDFDHFALRDTDNETGISPEKIQRLAEQLDEIPGEIVLRSRVAPARPELGSYAARRRARRLRAA